MELLQNIMAAVFYLGDTFGEGLVALSLGFAAKATGIGFLVGAFFMIIFQSVTPVSFQVEGLTVVSRRNNGDWRGMCYTVMLAGLIGALLGAMGVYGAIVNFIGEAIQGGMMVGAGLILAIVSFEMLKENWKIGIVSAGVAYILFIFVPSPDWGLIIALAGSVIAGIIMGRILGEFEPVVSKPEIEKVVLIPRSFKDIKFYVTKPEVIRATLAILALRTGTSIAYGGIDSELLAKVPANPDAVNITSGIASFFSGMFGGANVEPIISATAGAPNPVLSGVLLLILMGVILLCGLLPKVGKWVPTQSVVGFLLVLSTMIIIPENLPVLLKDPVTGAVAAGVTAAAIDPFLGMVVALIVRAFIGMAG
jgi:AGZA family xanthine/uracil permease-like MFS transporter